MNDINSKYKNIDDVELYRAMNYISTHCVTGIGCLQRHFQIGHIQAIDMLNELKKRGWLDSSPDGNAYVPSNTYSNYIEDKQGTINAEEKDDAIRLSCGLDPVRVESQAKNLSVIVHAANMVRKSGQLTHQETSELNNTCKKLQSYLEVSRIIAYDDELLTKVENAFKAAEAADAGRNKDIFLIAKWSLENLRSFLESARESVERAELCSSGARYGRAMAGVRSRVGVIDMRVKALAADWLSE